MRLRASFANRGQRWLLICGSILLVLLILLGLFPWGVFKGRIESHFAGIVGRSVSIGSMHRTGFFSYEPTIEFRDIRVPQPAWVGNGNLADIHRACVQINVFALLTGHIRPRAIQVADARISLVRNANGRKNWTRDSARSYHHNSLALSDLRLRDMVIDYRDALQGRHFRVNVMADEQGLRLNGRGTIKGHAVTLAAHGGAVSNAGRWPFRASIDGSAITMHINGVMDRPLDTHHMTLNIAAQASDLKLLDAIIEAGLFGTQPVNLTAKARRDGRVWHVRDLKGMIGKSDLTGQVDVKKAGGRTQVDGAVIFGRLDFDDLASDAGLAKAAAREQREGKRLVPATRIDLANLGDTDGTIRVQVKRIVSRSASSALRSLRATLTLDHRLLTVKPLVLGLSRGTIKGHVTVDQRSGAKVPLMKAALDLDGSSIAAMAGDGDAVNGQLVGRARLHGRGSTLREAVGNSDGHIGLVARNGSLPAKLASFLGFDVGRGLTTDSDKRSGLRCAVIGIALKDGTGSVGPMVIDTTRAQSHGTGTIAFPGEALDIRITGAPKAKTVLRLPGSLIVSGTIKDPHVHPSKGTKSVGNVLKAIGKAIVGDQAPRASDADCDTLEHKALDERAT